MAKSNLINSLFKIDAAEAFVRYVDTVKPYHSKILDVLIEYVYKEDIRASVNESWTMDVQQFKPTTPLVWDPSLDRWDGTKGLYDSSVPMCHYQAVNTHTYTNAIVIQGHHQEQFRPGDRILVTFEDDSSKVFIIQSAKNETSDVTVLYINVSAVQSDVFNQVFNPTNTPPLAPKTVQLSFAADYKIVGAITGTAGEWVIDGDHADEFIVGETITIANTTPNLLSSSVYTIASQPRKSYTTSVDLLQDVSRYVQVKQPSHGFVVNDRISFNRTTADWELDATSSIKVSGVVSADYFDYETTMSVSDATTDYNIVGFVPSATFLGGLQFAHTSGVQDYTSFYGLMANPSVPGVEEGTVLVDLYNDTTNGEWYLVLVTKPFATNTSGGVKITVSGMPADHAVVMTYPSSTLTTTEPTVVEGVWSWSIPVVCGGVIHIPDMVMLNHVQLSCELLGSTPSLQQQMRWKFKNPSGFSYQEIDQTISFTGMGPGQWIVLGQHASHMPPGAHFSVKNTNTTPVYYEVYEVGETQYQHLDRSTVVQPFASVSPTDIVTIITISPDRDVLASSEPKGVLQLPVTPAYEIINYTPTSWMINGQYASRFKAGDRIIVVDNKNTYANKDYVVLKDAESSTSMPYTTTIEVDSVPLQATVSGTIQHVSALTTSIPVIEPILERTSTKTYSVVSVNTSLQQITIRGRAPAVNMIEIIDGASPLTGTYTIKHLQHVVRLVSVDSTPISVECTLIDVDQPIPSDATLSAQAKIVIPTYRAVGTGTIRPTPRTYTQISEPSDPVFGAVWINPLTNVSMRWSSSSRFNWYLNKATNWVHNYTPTLYSWFDLRATERVLDIVKTYTSVAALIADTTPTNIEPGQFAVIDTGNVDDTDNAKMYMWNGSSYQYVLDVWSSSSDSVDVPTVTINRSISQVYNPQSADYMHANSFEVSVPSEYRSYEFAAISAKSNEFIFSKAYNIVAVDPIANTWTVDGIVTIIPGTYVYVTSSTTPQSQGAHLVVGTSHNTSTTDIVVSKRISRLASGDGILAVPMETQYLPRWVTGTQIKVSSTEQLPLALEADQVYYFIPVIAPYKDTSTSPHYETPATFALSTKRNPRDYHDYVDLTTFGAGVHTLTQNELFVPRSRIRVRDSYNNTNDGAYTVINAVQLTPTTARIYVNEHIAAHTPPTATNDGVIEYDLSSHVYSMTTERECVTQSTSELHASTTIREFITFEFTIESFDYIASQLYENEPRTSFLRDLGYDVPGMDTTGFDGDIITHTERSMSMLTAPSIFSHSIVSSIGFDTQFFDVGCIDETSSYVKHSNKTTIKP